MSMSVGSGGDDQPMMDINTTPLIDVMLVLLIYLIISLPPATHAVKLDMPKGAPQTEKTVDPEVINLEIDFDGTYLWNDTPVNDLATLEAYFKQESPKIPQPELHIRPNRRVKYDYVANALAAAQRNRMLRIGFVGNEQFMD
ncbi:MAG: biopolymer transporter ExbD [Candidatus Obscuribacterales bacterium]|nr:biopolymer transporter ExbD [Steroidobacteraceae bacterium]